MTKKECIMIIGGADSSAGAGVQADIKTCHEIGVYATTVITAITCQNTMGIYGMQIIDLNIIKGQIEAIFEEFDVKVIKLGMLYNSDIINLIISYLKPEIKVVLDPVMIATSGTELLDKNSILAMKNLLKYAFIVTPNTDEAIVLSSIPIKTKQDIKTAANKILKLGCKYIVIKGGHFDIKNKIITNILFSHDKDPIKFLSQRKSGEYHGTGCIFASAIATFLFKDINISQAVDMATIFVAKKIVNFK